jgi:hypothetical protein
VACTRRPPRVGSPGSRPHVIPVATMRAAHVGADAGTGSGVSAVMRRAAASLAGSLAGEWYGSEWSTQESPGPLVSVGKKKWRARGSAPRRNGRPCRWSRTGCGPRDRVLESLRREYARAPGTGDRGGGEEVRAVTLQRLSPPTARLMWR